MTHAYFKALLFLGSGAVIHALAGEQDIRKMGGLRKYIPVTFATFLVGTMAISGIPLLSGFFSKDEILWKAFSSQLSADMGFPLLWLLGFIAAGFTGFYMFRLLFVTFYGQAQFDPHHHHPHQAPNSMKIPLIILAFLSVIGGYIGLPKSLGGGNQFQQFLAPVFNHGEAVTHAQHALSTEYTLMALSIAIGLLGLFAAWKFYLKNPALPERIKQRYSAAYKTLLNKYYVDEFYGATVVKPFMNLALWFWQFFDVKIVDGLANGSASFVGWCSQIFRRFQTGYVRNYALGFSLGVIALLAFIIFG
jgi:NADH-quinone oxidoreductase subunit L